MIQEMQFSIIQRLRPLDEAGIDVQLRVLPNNPVEYSEQISMPQAVLTFEQGLFEDPPGRSSRYSQRWLMRHALELRIPAFWGPAGVATLLELACVLLIGFKPTWGDKIKLSGCNLAGQYDDTWVYRLEFVVPSRVTEQTEEEILPILQTITALNEGARLLLK